MDAKRPEPELCDYIRSNLRQGRRYAHITQKLMESGWLKEEIDLAYQEVLSPARRTEPTTRRLPISNPRPKTPYFSRFSPSAKKTFTTVAITIFLVVGVFFFLSGNVGQAIFFDKLIDGSKNATNGEVTYTVQCTPPHILNPDQSGCCLDSNSNGKCDFLEKEEVNVSRSSLQKECTENFQCDSRQCIDGWCGLMNKIYSQNLDGCSKVCNFYNVDLLTSDGERYSLKPGEGSYTGVGALDWQVLVAPPHCQGESVQIPLEITRNAFGKVLNSEIILLNQGESTRLLTHPGVPDLYFTLTLVKVYEICENSLTELQTTLIKQKVLQKKLEAKS